MEIVYYGHLRIYQKRSDYQGVLIFQIFLYEKEPFGTLTKCMDYASILIFKCLHINKFHYNFSCIELKFSFLV